MQFIDQISKINHLTSADEVAVYFKALRQDAMIWAGLQNILSDESKMEILIEKECKFDAGTVSLLSIDSDFDYSQFPKYVLPGNILERIMFEYEAYIQSDEPVAEFSQAAILAASLIEKRKVTALWKNVLLEIISRMKINTSAKFEEYWKTIFAITANLTENRDELLNDLVNLQQELGLGIFIHCVLCLPVADSHKVDIIGNHLLPASTQVQSLALRRLNESSNREFVRAVAQKLFEKYSRIEMDEQSYESYWNNPSSSLQFALQCQSAADIALFANEPEAALKLARKSMEILLSIEAIGKIKEISILGKENQNDQNLEFSTAELSRPEIAAELVYSNFGQRIPVSEDQGVYPVKALQESKAMVHAGNSDMAGVELSKIFNQLSDREIEEVLVKGPKFDPSWDAVKAVEILLNSDAKVEAGRLVGMLLDSNPTNIRVNQVAAKIFEKLGKSTAELQSLETLNVLEPDSVENKRKLGKAYLKAGEAVDAYSTMRLLIEGSEQPLESDLIDFAKVSLDLDKTDEVISTVERILTQNPEHVEALTLAGLAHYKNGQIETAIEKLEKSIEIPGEDPRAWIALSEIYDQNGNKDSAIKVLKAGMAANPDQPLLKMAFARNLMQNGAAAEAYPLLRELSASGQSRDIDFMFLDAVKELGREEIGIVLDEMKKRYPDDVRVQAEYGQNLVENGKLEEGFQILEGMKDDFDSNSDWALAYVKAFVGSDYSSLLPERKYSAKEIREAMSIIDGVITSQPENPQAKVLKGEMLAAAKQYAEAITFFGRVLEMEKSLGETWLARVHASLAVSASALGKNEIALASLEEAVNLRPDWIGLQQIKAETLLQAGEVKKAEAQFMHTLELASDSTLKSTWAARMWQQLGRSDEAQKAIHTAIEKFPKSLDLWIYAAELQMNRENSELEQETWEAINQLAAVSKDVDALIRCAAILFKDEKNEESYSLLIRAGEQGSTDARLDLAGYHRLNNELERSLQVLNTIEGIEGAVSLFKAEIEFQLGNKDAAYELLKIADNDLSEIKIEPEFLPAVWHEIITSTKPANALRLTLDLKCGIQSDSLAMVQEWIAERPENAEAKVFGVEIALASGAKESYASFLNMPSNNSSEPYSHQLDMLRIENDQDNSIFALSAEEPGCEDIDIANPLCITRVRSLAAEGQLLEAETILTEIINQISDTIEKPYVLRIGLVRNAIKAAVSVNCWKEAVELCRKFENEMSANDGMNLQFIRTLVSAIEFFNSAQGLNVEKHLPWNALFVALLQEQINQLFESVSEKQAAEAKRWLLRGTLALTPNQENIRALALIAPKADDAAAMMAGLRATNQSNTAIQVARKFNDDPAVLFELALCLSEKDTATAIELLTASVNGSPDQPLTLRLLSKLQENRGDKAAAAERLEEAILLWPNEPRWHVKAAEILTELGNLDEPVDHLLAALELEPTDVEILVKLGKAYLATKNPTQAMDYLQTAVQNAPNRAEIWEAIADAHQLAGNMNQALDAAERASQADPFAVRPHIQAGKVYWTKGEIEKALNQVRLAISLNPEDAESYVFLAHLLQEKGEKVKALETLEKASHCKTVTVGTMIEHARLVKEINGSVAARDLLASFSQCFPENPELLRLLAEAEEDCGDLKKAEVAAKRALEMHPEETELHLFMGNLQEKNGNLDQAVHYFSQAIAHNPIDFEAYIKLSQAFVKQREFSKARSVLEEGIRRSPEDIDLYLACANLLKEVKDYRGAEQMLRKASLVDPKNLIVHRQLGAVLALNLVHQSQEVSSHI